MAKKIALIFGITGQDGSYLADYLLKKNYIVHGVKEDLHLLILEELIISTKTHMRLKENLFYTMAMSQTLFQYLT